LQEKQNSHKCIVFKFCNYNTFQPSIQVTDQISRQIVRHRARGRNLFNLNGDGVGLEDPTQIGITVSDATSFSTTIGMLVAGSIISREFSPRHP